MFDTPLHHTIVIPMEDALVHTDDAPFCTDETCPCHESPELLETLARQVEAGLLTPEEATTIALGKTIQEMPPQALAPAPPIGALPSNCAGFPLATSRREQKQL